MQLLNGAGSRPYDFTFAGDTRTYGDLITVAGLKVVNDYAAGIGPTRDLIIPRPSHSRSCCSRLVDSEWLRSGVADAANDR